MHDIKRIREQTEAVRAGLRAKGVEPDLDGILALDQRRRECLAEAEALKNERNVVSKEIGRLKKSGADTAERQAAMRAIGEKIERLDAEAAAAEAERDRLLLRIPNTPHGSVPVGADVSGNRVVRSWGAIPRFDFAPKSHVEIGAHLRLFDFERATRLTGAGFPLFTGLGARLERALIQFMLDLHTTRHGYTEISPPFVVNSASMTGTGQLPKMAEDMYHIPSDDLWLIPTAEVPVTNLYRDEIITQKLPIYLTAYTPCFRREAGAAGRETRGLIRVHQFDKVEMVKFVEPETSYDELEKLVANAETVLQTLGLAYRVLMLCTGDLSFAAAKCYDLELWAPGQNGWLEVSSCSNFEDFQARRAGIRYRTGEGKVRFVHTLNGSGVALARLVVAILEQCQQADGSVTVPEALRPYLGGLTRMTPPPAE